MGTDDRTVRRERFAVLIVVFAVTAPTMLGVVRALKITHPVVNVLLGVHAVLSCVTVIWVHRMMWRKTMHPETSANERKSS